MVRPSPRPSPFPPVRNRMVKHNNVLPNAHFHKHWQERVKCWFDQAPQKKSRRIRREKKAKRIFPRPVGGSLRPVVHPPTRKYNAKLRLGRGFTLEECKGAGIHPQFAKSIGIAVDHRRRNKTEESLALNVQRLKEYQSKLILFPRNKNKPKAGDSPAEVLKNVQQFSGSILPIKKAAAVTETREITEDEKKVSVYAQLRQARAFQRYVGRREKRAKALADKQK
uniref:60S ribosomal protein L13 n=1 Tax=Paramoeba aestuarina TaxID=180227 RepID=A0A7S4P0R6_9EUKA